MNRTMPYRSWVPRPIGSGALAVSVLSAVLLMGLSARAQTETVLYSFTGGSDGGNPEAALISDGAGNLYGTTALGGYEGLGTVFELSPNGSGGWNETVLHEFCPEGGEYCQDGADPYYCSLILDGARNLYGTTFSGGANGAGVVFELSPVGGSWTETVLYNSPSGYNLEYGLIADAAGNLYGTTYFGQGGGTIFELSPSAGGWTEQQLYVIAASSLTMDSGGNIYGIDSSLGPGTAVFELSPNGSGGWNQTQIHTFPDSPKDGIGASGRLVLDQAGNIYGTTELGGARNHGTVYKLTPITEGKKKGTWTEKILYSFTGGRGQGLYPFGGVVLDAAGNIYGTTDGGGGKVHVGTVFELAAPAAKGKYSPKILLSFDGTDGDDPLGSLIMDGAGNVYGTTFWGGPEWQPGGANGNGVVFEVTP